MASGVVEQAADLLGLEPAGRTRLRALTDEVVTAVVRGAFEGSEQIDLEVEVVRAAGALRFIVRDHGAPLDFARGYPPRVADLIRLGFADGLDFRYEARQGNRTEITKSLSYSSLATDAAFTAMLDEEPAAEPPVGEDGEALVDIRPMTADDVLGVARLFYRCYGNTAAYASLMYEPERLAEYVEQGKHVATIAVTPAGRVVGHLASTIEDPRAHTGRVGYYAVDPAWRQHKIGLRVAWAHIPRLLERGIIGQYSETVTVHPGSQRSALRNGGHEVGLMLARQTKELDFSGFDEDQDLRKAVVLFYIPIAEQPARESTCPGVRRRGDPHLHRGQPATDGPDRLRAHAGTRGGGVALHHHAQARDRPRASASGELRRRLPSVAAAAGGTVPAQPLRRDPGLPPAVRSVDEPLRCRSAGAGTLLLRRLSRVRRR